jgi:O-antigen ligase
LAFILNRIVLTLVFVISFATYMAPDLNITVQLVPLILFAILVFFKVGFSDFVLIALESLFDVEGLILVFGVPLLTLGQSIESTFDKSLPYWGVISSCLILSRLYTALTPLQEVFESFFWSAVVCLAVFLPVSYWALQSSIDTLVRFAPYNFHPNLLAWIMAGYFCAMVWKLWTGTWLVKIIAVFGIVICLADVFFASSRAAIVAIVLGCGVVGAMAMVRAARQGRNHFLWVGITAGLLLVATTLYTYNHGSVQDTVDFVDQVLSLSTTDRGIDSGFTGRVDKWANIIRSLSDGTFLIGRGVRSSDAMETMIDNSYLVILYDLGLLPLIVIVYRFLSILYRSFRGYFVAATDEKRYFCLLCTLITLIVLVTNFAERSLFAVGNPFSLLAFFMLAAPAWQVRTSDFLRGGEQLLERAVV